jgi:hypothetical protein
VTATKLKGGRRLLGSDGSMELKSAGASVLLGSAGPVFGRVYNPTTGALTILRPWFESENVPLTPVSSKAVSGKPADGYFASVAVP